MGLGYAYTVGAVGYRIRRQIITVERRLNE